MLLLIETLSNFRAIKCRFILYLQMYVLGFKSANSNVLYIPPGFPAFHISLTFAR